ncbi:MAG: hypothetical protein EOO46_19705 [Flavobacterium sp.]|nr:MAG: hypothetical protein EOO46_19705 [Flavobacterium sp.]
MGNPVSKIVETVVQSKDDPAKKDNPSLEEEMKDQVVSIQRAAEQESKEFYRKILQSTYDQTHEVPISKVLYKYTKIEVMDSVDEQAAVTLAIEDTVKEVTSSSVSGVISGLMGTAIKALFGKKSMNYSVEEGYTISLGLLGGIERFDFRFVRRSFAYKTWVEKLQSVVSITVVVSSCSILELSLNDTKVIVQNCFSALSKLDPQAHEDPVKTGLINELQLKMHTLLTYQIKAALTEEPIDLDEQLKIEEGLIFDIDRIYRKVSGMDSTEAIQAVKTRLASLRAKSLNKAAGKPHYE